jgi:hypothetical protein
MAFDFRKLMISAAGLLLLQLGWTLFDIAFSGSIGVTPDVLPRSPAARPVENLSWSAEAVGRLTHRLFEPGRILATPLNAMLDPRSNVPTMLHALAGVAWLIVVWGLCGGAISRITVLQEAQLRNPGIAEAVRFAWKSGDALVLAPFCFLGALAFCSLSGLLLGLIYRLPGGEAVAGALLFIPLAAGLVMTLLVVTLIAGWPFFHAALAAGAEGALDAMSRTYSCLNQRLVLLAVGVAMAWATGIAGLALVDLLTEYTIRLTQWSLSLSGPRPRVLAMFWRTDLNSGTFALATHQFWLGGVRLLAHAWVYSFFWSAASLLYLWLRQEVDGTPWTVVDSPEALPTAAIARGDGATDATRADQWKRPIVEGKSSSPDRTA